MKIGIVGTGKMGQTIGTLLSEKGHEVKFSYSRSREKLQKLAQLNNNTSSGTLQEAVTFGDVILLAVPFSCLKEILTLPDIFRYKIVITCINGIETDFTGDTVGLATHLQLSVAEHIQDSLQMARVIEAFNIIFAAILELPARNGMAKKPVIFYCGDDRDAKKIVASLIEDCNCIPVNTGSLKTARSLETLSAGWIQFAVVAGLYPRIAIHTLNY